MSKKLKTRLILLLVAGIWGYNLFRIYSNYQTEKDLEENNQVYSDLSYSPVMFNKDSFELVLPDVDPFLKKGSKYSGTHNTSNNKSNNLKVKKIQRKESKKEVPQTVSWPSIKYLGFVKNHSNEDALCLIRINENMFKVSEGDEQAGVFISGVYRDSIHLVFSGEERTFRKG
ncbi:MAG: hypothetical protein HUJ25_17840 [Crocinitomicaceae bacterium]|nr:hypothetical protein [Crocinitomicaceae bacterium]